jgi:hypothetical protein
MVINNNGTFSVTINGNDNVVLYPNEYNGPGISTPLFIQSIVNNHVTNVSYLNVLGDMSYRFIKNFPFSISASASGENDGNYITLTDSMYSSGNNTTSIPVSGFIPNVAPAGYITYQVIGQYQSTSLSLPGLGVLNYGPYIVNDLIDLLTNFSSYNPPISPVTGQIWYDSLLQSINVYNGSQWVGTGSSSSSGASGSDYDPTSLPPAGPAGGSLAGNYPDPTLASTAVVAGSYTYASFTVNAAGQLTSASSGNPVTAFNNRTGNVTLTTSDVTNALTYTPVNPSQSVSWVASQNFAAGLTSTTGSFSGTITQTPGSGATNETPFAQYGDLFLDAIVTVPTPVPALSSTLNGVLPAFDVYITGQRVAYAGGNYTVSASTTSYLDLSNTGVLTVSTSTTVTTNSLRLWSVTSSTTGITAIALMATIGTPLRGPLQLDGNQIRNFSEQTASTQLSTQGVLSLDFTTGSVQEIELSANATSTTIVNLPASGSTGSLTLIITQGTGGSFTVIWPTGTKWSNGTAPTLSTAAGAVDIVVLTTPDAGTTWYGFLAGKGMA